MNATTVVDTSLQADLASLIKTGAPFSRRVLTLAHDGQVSYSNNHGSAEESADHSDFSLVSIPRNARVRAAEFIATARMMDIIKERSVLSDEFIANHTESLARILTVIGDNQEEILRFIKDGGLSSKADMERIAGFIELYGQGFPSVYFLVAGPIPGSPGLKRFADKEINLRQLLLRLCTAVNINDGYAGRTSLAGLPGSLFREHPLRAVELAERYGPASSGLFKRFASRLLKVEAMYRDYFVEVAKRCGKNGDLPLREVPLVRNPESKKLIFAMAELLGQAAGGIFGHLPGRQTPAKLSKALELIGRYGLHAEYILFAYGNDAFTLTEKQHEAMGKAIRFVLEARRAGNWQIVHEIFESLQGDRDKAKLMRLSELSDRYGAAAVGLLKAFGKDVLEKEQAHREFLCGLHDFMHVHDVDHQLCEVFGTLNHGLLDRHAELAMSVIREVDLDPFSVMNYFPDELAEKDAKLVVDLAKALGCYAGVAYDAIPAELVPAHSGLLREIAETNGPRAPYAYRSLSPALVSEKPDFFRELHTRYGPALWGLLERFGADIERGERAYRTDIERIISITGAEGAGEFFQLVPAAKWGEPHVIKFVEFYREAAGREYLYRRCSFDKYEEPRLKELRQLNQDKFGIFNFYRYTKGTASGAYDVSILEDNLRNCDPAYNAHLPIAVIVHARDDYNDSMSSASVTYFKQLAHFYKVLIFEAATHDEVTKALETAHAIFKENPDSKGIGLFQVRAHSNWSHMSLADSSTYRPGNPGPIPKEKTRISIDDAELFRTWAKYLAADAHVILGGCRTARGGVNADNLAKRWHSEMPWVTLHASRIVCSFRGCSFKDDGRIMKAWFSGPADKHVLIAPAER